jgi:hypothetical protein
MSEQFLNSPAPPARRIVKYMAQIRFANGTTGRIQIEAGNATGAAAKLAGLFSDQPARIVGWQVDEMFESRIVLARVIPP